MYNAKIINNNIYCGKCNSNNISGVRDYKQVVHNDRPYTLFQIKCYNCNTDNQYIADVMLERTIRYEISDKINEINGE